MIRRPWLLFALAALAYGQTTPNISNVTNAAFPSVDMPPGSLTVTPRSMAIIFGTNLADTTVSTAPPWKTTLGGTEVHLASDTCFDLSCDAVATLIYVSPTQVNFVVPDIPAIFNETAYRVVLVRDGQRFDNRSYMLGGPGRIAISVDDGDIDVVFQVGYDCLFSYSLGDPVSCGISWSPSQHRAPLGAVTDAASGLLISSQAPVHQGQIITLWLTDLLYDHVTLNPSTGLLDGTPQGVNFGVAQLGKDVAPTNNIAFGTSGPYAEFGIFATGDSLWAGESPQFVGLDQVTVAFPTCTHVPSAVSEKRYDAFMPFTRLVGMPVGYVETGRLYLAFVVRPGDPDCQFDGRMNLVE